MKKNRIITCIILLCSLICRAEGISDISELQAFISAYNKGASIAQWTEEDGSVILDADIDMSKAKKFTPIKCWKGVFDGRGYSIKAYNGKSGFFHEIAMDAEVRNLSFDAKCTVKAQSGSEEHYVGMIADINCGMLKDCESNGQVIYKAGSMEYPIWVGGLVGQNRGYIFHCKNNGEVKCDCSGTIRTDGLHANIGGLAGGAPHQKNIFAYGAFVGYCENTGKVSYSGDYPTTYMGGIVGKADVVACKYCINRGEVYSLCTTSGKKDMCTSTIGGIAGLTHGDIISCDNYGPIHSAGNSVCNGGGILGIPLAIMVLGDCVNYGEVKGENTCSCNLGGIAGNVVRAARLQRCINRGNVYWAGTCPDRSSHVGGIAGSGFAKSNTTEGAYIRNNANYGLVSSVSGGNKNTDKNANLTGGIIGSFICPDGHRASLLDNANFGEVKAESGFKSPICPKYKNVKVGGHYLDEYAKSASLMSNGSNVYGLVRDNNGQPVEGVVVSDGAQCVTTDQYGWYEMKSNLDSVKFVFYSCPADFKVETYRGLPIFYKRIQRHEEAVQADFTLYKRENPCTDYTFCVIGDPQMRPYGVDGSAEAWNNIVAPDLAEFRKSQGPDFFSINAGDLVYNFMQAYPDYLDGVEKIQSTVYNVMGNHDFDQATLFDQSLGDRYFEIFVGPQNYSFNIGEIHYVVLSNILYNKRNKADEKYGDGLTDETLRWLRDDLKNIPESTTLVISGHAQLYRKPWGSWHTNSTNYQNYTEILKKYKKVYTWSGHYHTNGAIDYAANGKKPANVTAIGVNRCTGALRFNKYIGAHGDPMGYMVVDVKGSELSWYYKSVGHDKSYQMRTYGPERVGAGLIKATIWNWNQDWQTPALYVDGEKVAEMEFVSGKDPDCVAQYEAELALNPKKKFRFDPVGTTALVFQTTTPSEHGSGEIRVTDNFGNEFKENISW